MRKMQEMKNKYIIKKFIDSGGTSTVYKCIDNETGLPRAAKFFENIPLNSFEREVNIMKKISEINSPSLMKCYESGFSFLTEKGESNIKMYSTLINL